MGIGFVELIVIVGILGALGVGSIVLFLIVRAATGGGPEDQG